MIATSDVKYDVIQFSPLHCYILAKYFIDIMTGCLYTQQYKVKLSQEQLWLLLETQSPIQGTHPGWECLVYLSGEAVKHPDLPYR